MHIVFTFRIGHTITEHRMSLTLLYYIYCILRIYVSNLMVCRVFQNSCILKVSVHTRTPIPNQLHNIPEI